jgi:TctA family transporter
VNKFLGAEASGDYSRNNVLGVWAMLGFAVFGCLLERFAFFIPIFVLAFILGPLGEASFMLSMVLFDNDARKFFSQPPIGMLITLGILSIAGPFVRAFSRRIRSRGRSRSEAQVPRTWIDMRRRPLRDVPGLQSEKGARRFARRPPAAKRT